MSFCDFDMLSACGSLDGFPGQDDTALPLDSLPLAVSDNLEALEVEQRSDRARLAALEAARTVEMSAERYPFELSACGDALPCPYELVDPVPDLRSKDREIDNISRISTDPDDVLESSFGSGSTHSHCPPARPPTPFPFCSISPSSAPSTPSLCPSSPSTCALDLDEFAAIYPPRPSPYLDGDELIERLHHEADSTGNRLAVARYLPPARRFLQQRMRREAERRERRDQKRRDREARADSSSAPRTYYATLIPGVFDTVRPSEKRTAEFMAARIATNCFAIAASPNELSKRISHLDAKALQTIFRITELLRANIPDVDDYDEIVRILQCAAHAYGLDFKCLTASGSVVWCRDVNLRLDPAAQELIYQFFSDPSRTFSQEQIRRLRALPQYWHEEGRRIFVPMMRRALPESVRAPRAYV